MAERSPADTSEEPPTKIFAGVDTVAGGHLSTEDIASLASPSYPEIEPLPMQMDEEEISDMMLEQEDSCLSPLYVFACIHLKNRVDINAKEDSDMPSAFIAELFVQLEVWEDTSTLLQLHNADRREPTPIHGPATRSNHVSPVPSAPATPSITTQGLRRRRC